MRSTMPHRSRFVTYGDVEACVHERMNRRQDAPTHDCTHECSTPIFLSISFSPCVFSFEPLNSFHGHWSQTKFIEEPNGRGLGVAIYP